MRRKENKCGVRLGTLVESGGKLFGVVQQRLKLLPDELVREHVAHVQQTARANVPAMENNDVTEIFQFTLKQHVK